MAPGQLRSLILSALVRQHGGSRSIWSRALGELRLYARSTHPHCSWDVRPTGTPAEVERIGRVVDELRATYPHLDPA